MLIIIFIGISDRERNFRNPESEYQEQQPRPMTGLAIFPNKGVCWDLSKQPTRGSATCNYYCEESYERRTVEGRTRTQVRTSMTSRLVDWRRVSLQLQRILWEDYITCIFIFSEEPIDVYFREQEDWHRYQKGVTAVSPIRVVSRVVSPEEATAGAVELGVSPPVDGGVS